nr:hypothetical protein [Xanthomonadales bacterium]
MKALVLALLATLPLIATATAQDLSAANDGIRYETREHAPGVSRAASWSPHAATLDARQSSTLIERKEAAFIKVYFDHVHLPDGWQLAVSHPESGERYVYTARGGDDRTVEADIGQNGVSSFAAMSISGDRARVELLPPRDATLARELPRVVMSHVLEGYPDAVVSELRDTGLLSSGDPEHRAICGLDNKQRPACYSGNAFNRSRAVARILVGGGSCTGWRIGSGDRMMTNNHCIGSSADVSATEVWFNFQHSACSGT